MKYLHLVSGVSLKGKNRIVEHGHMWISDTEGYHTLNRDKKLISVSTGYTRWLDFGDRDFRIEKTWELKEEGIK